MSTINTNQWVRTLKNHVNRSNWTTAASHLVLAPPSLINHIGMSSASFRNYLVGLRANLQRYLFNPQFRGPHMNVRRFNQELRSAHAQMSARTVNNIEMTNAVNNARNAARAASQAANNAARNAAVARSGREAQAARAAARQAARNAARAARQAANNAARAASQAANNAARNAAVARSGREAQAARAAKKAARNAARAANQAANNAARNAARAAQHSGNQASGSGTHTSPPRRSNKNESERRKKAQANREAARLAELRAERAARESAAAHLAQLEEQYERIFTNNSNNVRAKFVKYAQQWLGIPAGNIYKPNGTLHKQTTIMAKVAPNRTTNVNSKAKRSVLFKRVPLLFP